MEKVVLSKELAQELQSENEIDGYKVVSDKLTRTTRWSHIHYLVIERLSDGLLFGRSYSRGIDQAPFDNNGDFIDFEQVEAQEVVIIEYKVKDAQNDN